MFVIFGPSGSPALKNQHDSVMETTAWTQQHFQKSQSLNTALCAIPKCRVTHIYAKNVSGKKLVKRPSGKLFCGQPEIWNSYWKTWMLCPPDWGREGPSDLLSELSAGVACLHSRPFIKRKYSKHRETRNTTVKQLESAIREEKDQRSSSCSPQTSDI